MAWTYFEAAHIHFLDEQKPFYYFFVVWGGSVLLWLIRSLTLNRSIAGRITLSYRFRESPFILGAAAFCCGFTLHALAAATPEFDVAHLNMPFFLPALFLPLHFLILGWLFYTREGSRADRGLYLILFFHAMNGAIFNTPFFLIAGLALLTLMEALIENRGRWILPPLFISIPLAVMLVFAILSTVLGINPVKSSQALAHVVACAAILALVVSRPRDTAFYVKLVGVTLLASLLVLIAALLVVLLVGGLLGLEPVRTTRLTVFYQHPNFLSPYLAMIVLLALSLFFIVRRRWIKAGLIFFIPLSAGALYLTDSRAGFLGFIAGLSVLVFMFAPFRRRGAKLLSFFGRLGKPKIMALAFLVLTAFVVAAVLYSDKVVSAFRQSTRLRRALDYRLDAWENSIEVIKGQMMEYKPYGIGLDTFISIKKFPPGSKFSHESTAPHPHNILLYITQSSGPIALISFLVLLGGYLYCSAVLFRSVDDRNLNRLIIGITAAACTLLACGMLDLGLSLVTLFPGPLWLFLAIVASAYNDHSGRRIFALKPEGRSVLVDGSVFLALLALFAYSRRLPGIQIWTEFLLFLTGLAGLKLLAGIFLPIAVSTSSSNRLLPQVVRGVFLFPRAALVLLVVVLFFFNPGLSRMLLDRAHLAERIVNIEEGVRLALQSLAVDPFLTEARDFLLRRYIWQNSHDEAYGLLETASDLEPENAELRMNMGNILTMLENYESAAQDYRMAVEIDHGSKELPRYYAQLITTEACCGWKAEAVEHLKAAIRRDIAVINIVHWQVRSHESGRDDQYLPVGTTDEEIRLEDILDEIHADLKASAEAGDKQDRFDWFSVFQAYNNAFIYAKALAVLDDIEAIFKDQEKASVQFHRAAIARVKENLEESKEYLELAKAQGQAIDEGASLYFETRKIEALLLEEKYDEAIALLREILKSKRDYLNYGYSFTVALDLLIGALDAKGDPAAKIEPLKKRIFFAGEKQAKIPYLADLAACYRSAGRFQEAEKTLIAAVDLMAATRMRLRQFEDISKMESLQRPAYLLADLYKDMGLSKVQSLYRAWHATDFFSPNPVRFLFRYFFLMRAGIPERALSLINLALMDDQNSLLLLDRKIECCQMLDDLEGLKEAFHAMSKAFPAKGIDIDARCQGLYSTILEEPNNVALILELVKLMSYQFNFPHALNVVREVQKIHPDESRLHLQAARIYRVDDKPLEALASLEEALRLNPSDVIASAALENLRAHLKEENNSSKREGP